MPSIDFIKNKPWTEWTEQEKALFRDCQQVLNPGPVSAASYATLCHILEAVYQRGAEGEWNEIDLESIPLLVSDQSRHTANLVLCVLGLMGK